MTTAQVVETSATVNNNSPIQDYFHSDGQTRPTFEMTPGFKPFTKHALLHRRKLWSQTVLLSIDKRASCLGTDKFLVLQSPPEGRLSEACTTTLNAVRKGNRESALLAKRVWHNLTCIASFFSAFPLWRHHYQQSIPRTPEGVLPNSQRRSRSVTTKSTYF